MYYEEITSSEFYNKTQGKNYDLSKKEVSLFLGSDLKIFKSMTGKYSFNIKSNRGYQMVTISKLSDEWYYIRLIIHKRSENDKEYFFKCDQFDGFEKFFNDFFSKKPTSLVKLFEEYNQYYTEITRLEYSGIGIWR